MSGGEGLVVELRIANQIKSKPRDGGQFSIHRIEL